MTLYEKLAAYRDSDYYGFHMPGHKRNESMPGTALPYGIDITEIDGFDDLHHAKEILKEAQERAAKLYGAEETCYLINGSTVGILSAIMGCTEKGDTVLVARNCHKSVYHAIFMNELHAEYVYPQYLEKEELNGEIKAEDVRRILSENKENSVKSKGNRIRAVMIVSPTYDGVVSDVKAIAEVTHEYGIPLIVDEAHGAHFGFDSYFPQNANHCGADVVIHSLHKTLPSMTQTALIHMNGELADKEKIKSYLHMLQTSSPSYVLMASMDECIYLLETSRAELFEKYTERLEQTRNQLKQLNVLCLAETEHYDKSKLVISTKKANKSGRWLYSKLLNSYHLQMEMAAGNYIVAMTSVADTEEGFKRFTEAIKEIDKQLEEEHKKTEDRIEENRGEPCRQERASMFELPRLQQEYTNAQIAKLLKRYKKDLDISRCEKEDAGMTLCSKAWMECEGMISTEYAYLYPPGIPLIVPGERVSGQVIDLLERYKNMGFAIEGLNEDGMLRVLMKRRTA